MGPIAERSARTQYLTAEIPGETPRVRPDPRAGWRGPTAGVIYAEDELSGSGTFRGRLTPRPPAAAKPRYI